jgi:hypothetical protein
MRPSRAFVLVSVFSLLSALALAQLPPPAPAPRPAQEPPPPPAPPAPTAPAFDADVVVAEIRAFYDEYWKAWDDRNTQSVANGLAGEFVQYMPAPARGVLQADKPTAVANVDRFFQAVEGRDTLWVRTLLSVVPRSTTEAVAAVRIDFTLVDSGSQVELSVETLKKGADGRWRLVRKWTER